MEPNSNQLIDLNDLTNTTSNTSPSNILWNENEDTFLQNLFANTLLNDDFSKKPEFDLGLGFDNLQLNYDSSNTNSALIELSDTNNSTQNQDTLNTDRLLIIQDLKLTSSNPTDLTFNDFIAPNDLNLANLNNYEQNDKCQLINDDDKLFKRPSNDFVTIKQTNSKLLLKQTGQKGFKTNKKEDLVAKKINSNTKQLKDVNKQKEIQSVTNSLSTNSSNTISNENAIINKLKRSRAKRSKYLNSQLNNQQLDQLTGLKSINNKHTNKTNKQCLNQINFSRNTNNKIIIRQQNLKLTSPNNNNNINNLTQTQNFKSFEPLNKKFAHSNLINLKLTSNTAKSTNDSNDSGPSSSDLEKNIFILNNNDYNDDNSNHLILKNRNNNLVLKRDEVDLHIKELSLLDLHSSEDDSSNDLTKKKQNDLKFVKANISSSIINKDNQELTQLSTSSSSTSSTSQTLNTLLIEQQNQSSSLNNLNEIISKRVKYTTSSNSIFQTNLQDDKKDDMDKSSLIIIAHNTNNNKDQNSQTIQKNNLDKLVQYFKSLESSNKEPIIVTTQSSQKLTKDPSKKSLDSLLSPPSPSNIQKTQNKRKKKDDQQTQDDSDEHLINQKQQQQTQQSEEPIVFISLSSEQSKMSNIIPQNKSQQSLNLNLENDTLQHMKNLDINNTSTNVDTLTNSNQDITIDLKDKNSRNYLWNLLKSNSTDEELIENFGSALHDKISFWDLAQLKLKFSKFNHLKTTYDIIDDYTILYANMSALLERFVNEQSNLNALIGSSKKENSSRSRSSSRNLRKQSTSSSNR